MLSPADAQGAEVAETVADAADQDATAVSVPLESSSSEAKRDFLARLVEVVCSDDVVQDGEEAVIKAVEKSVESVIKQNEKYKEEHVSVELTVNRKYRCPDPTCKNRDQREFEENYKQGDVVCKKASAPTQGWGVELRAL